MEIGGMGQGHFIWNAKAWKRLKVIWVSQEAQWEESFCGFVSHFKSRGRWDNINTQSAIYGQTFLNLIDRDWFDLSTPEPISERGKLPWVI